MNKKIIALLSTVLSGALIVGGAFATTAAWAVTDTANPISAKITGGDLGSDDTKYVTLSWGSSTKLDNVQNMEDGVSYKVGVLDLRTDDADYSRGTLQVSLVKDTEGTKLHNYVKVDLYEGNENPASAGHLPSADPLATLAAQKDVAQEASRNYTISHVATGTKTGGLYSVYVTLDCDESVATYAQVKDDIVYVRVDWVPDSADVVTTKRVYFAAPSDWGTNPDIRVYAWYKDGDDKTIDNGGWPGVAAVKESVRGTGLGTQYYYADVSNNFTSLLFNNNNGMQTDDMLLTGATGYTTAAPAVTYNGDGHFVWAELPDLTQAVTYKLVGTIGGADKWKFADGTAFETTATAGEYKITNISLTKDDEIKAMDSNGTWYPNGGDNYVINETASYDIYFRPAGNSDWGYYYLYVAKHV